MSSAQALASGLQPAVAVRRLVAADRRSGAEGRHASPLAALAALRPRRAAGPASRCLAALVDFRRRTEIVRALLRVARMVIQLRERCAFRCSSSLACRCRSAIWLCRASLEAGNSVTAAAGVAAGVPAEGAVASVLGPAADPVERVGGRGTIRSWELPGTVSKARHAVSAPTPPGHRKPGDEAGKSPVERVRVHAAILEMAIRKVGTAAGSTNVPATATASTACPRGVNAPSALAQTRLMLRAPDTTSISRLSARSGTAGIRRCVTQTAELAPNAARMITSSALPSSGTAWRIVSAAARRRTAPARTAR